MNIELIRKINDVYSHYFEKELSDKRFTHKDIIPLLNKLSGNDRFKVQVIGKSVEQRDIFSVIFGTGKTTVLLWSQMHGDEPTATMALFDIFNFLSGNDEYNSLREKIKNELTLIFIPMLNPDSTERITRQNAVGIDLNRDAKRLQSPESKILMNAVEQYKPDFAFNLHDQDYRWSVGDTEKLAAISLLAPVFDDKKSVNESRLRAMQLITLIKDVFNEWLPGQIARYSDDFDPRSFGDTISGKGASTILIESGRVPGDIHKMLNRKYNFLMMMFSFMEIVDKDYTSKKESEYYSIPTNGKFLYELIIRNLIINHKGEEFKVDIAIDREEVYEDNSRKPIIKSIIRDIGDLYPFKSMYEYNADGLMLEPGKILEHNLTEILNMNDNKIKELISEGYLFVKSNNEEISLLKNLPFKIINDGSATVDFIKLNSEAFFNMTKNNGIVKHVINGEIFDKVLF